MSAAASTNTEKESLDDERTKDDAAIAYQLQQNEIEEREARNRSGDAGLVGPTIVGRPIYNESSAYYQRYEYDDEEAVPITGAGDLSEREQYILEVFSLGKSIACLAVL